MPMYTYFCPKCNITTERLVKASDSTAQDCVECATRLDRQFPLPHLHGSVEVDSKGRIWKGTSGASTPLTKKD